MMKESDRSFVHIAVQQLLANGHAIAPAPELGSLQSFYSAWSDFFCDAGKQRFRASANQVDGYFPMNVERAVRAAQADPKEFFHYMEGTKLPASLRPSTVSLFDTLALLSSRIVDELAFAFPICKRRRAQLVSRARMVLRIIRYPVSVAHPQYSAAPHTDIDFITLLPPATSPGLAVLTQNGTWEMLTPSGGEVALLSGDMLERISLGAARATVHRVDPSYRERLAVAFFMNPADETVIAEGVTAGELVAERLREISCSADEVHASAGRAK